MPRMACCTPAIFRSGARTCTTIPVVMMMTPRSAP
jgi:hypothetical protein